GRFSQLSSVRMEDMLLELWKQHFAWRPSYYKRFLKTRRYLNNYRDIVPAAEQALPKHLDFRAGYTFTLIDADTGLQTFDEIFIHDHYKLPANHAAKTIIDLGANIGLFSLYAHLKMPNPIVFAIE